MLEHMVGFFIILMPAIICMSCCWYVGRTFEKCEKMYSEVIKLRHDVAEIRNQE